MVRKVLNGLISQQYFVAIGPNPLACIKYASVAEVVRALDVIMWKATPLWRST